MKAATSTHISHKRLVMPLNLSQRVAGTFYMLYGLAALFKLSQYSASGHGSLLNLVAGLILGSFVIFGFGLGLWTETLVVDSVAHNYIIKKGVWPFLHLSEGPLTDVRSVTIVKNIDSLGEGDSGDVSVSPMLIAQLEWRDGRQPLQLFSVRQESGLFSRYPAMDRIQCRASKVASYLNCHVEDQSSR